MLLDGLPPRGLGPARLDLGHRQNPLYCSSMRPATAIIILILLAVIVIAAALQLRSILSG